MAKYFIVPVFKSDHGKLSEAMGATLYRGGFEDPKAANLYRERYLKGKVLCNVRSGTSPRNYGPDIYR